MLIGSESRRAGAAERVDYDAARLASRHDGALSKSGKEAEREAGEAKTPEPRHAGMVVAVRISERVPEQRAIEVLKRHGARDIERAEGTWRNGKWEDFDPLSAPQRVSA